MGRVSLAESNGVSTVTFSSPTNAVDAALLRELREAFVGAQGHTVLFVASENFSTGFDLEELSSADRQEFFELAQAGQELCALIENSSKLTVAVLTGYVLGPGLEIALACDFRVASDTALLGFPETRLGLIPSFGTTRRLTTLLGPSRTKRLFSGTPLHADEAQLIGLVDEVTEKPAQRAVKVANLLAKSPAVREAKRLAQGTVADERNAFAGCCTDETKSKIGEFLKRAQKT